MPNLWLSLRELASLTSKSFNFRKLLECVWCNLTLTLIKSLHQIPTEQNSKKSAQLSAWLIEQQILSRVSRAATSVSMERWRNFKFFTNIAGAAVVNFTWKKQKQFSSLLTCSPRSIEQLSKIKSLTHNWARAPLIKLDIMLRYVCAMCCLSNVVELIATNAKREREEGARKSVKRARGR